MSVPVIEDYDENRPLRQDDEGTAFEQDEMIKVQQILGKCRSDYISNIDRETLAEQKDLFYTPKLAGIFGFGLPFVDKDRVYQNKKNKKTGLTGEDQNLENAQHADEVSQKLRANSYFLLQQDGIFTAGQETGTSAANIRRLEQSLIEDKKFYFFDEEGELIIDNEFFDEKMQRIHTIEFEDNPSLATMTRSATLCSRVNQNKQNPFKLDIFLGTLEFSYHPLFSKEDCLIQDMRYLMKKYRIRADLALLPHYKKTRDILQKELSELQNRPDYPKKEMQMIKTELDKTELLQTQEKHLLQTLMNQIYTQWEAVKFERTNQDYTSSPHKLVVRQYVSNENTNETEFLLQDTDVNEESTIRSKAIPRSEQGRRTQIKNFPVQLYLVINNQVVAKSEKKLVLWPKFQCQFMQKLQVYVFTKPSTIKIRIMQATLVPKLIDTIEVELPGEKSNTVTSAGFLLKQAYFSEGRELVRKQRYQNLVLQDMSKQEQDQAQEDQQKQRKDFEFEGYVSYRTEWAGFGPKMPPDSMDMQYESTYQKYEDDQEETLSDKRDQTYFDVNDPRNEDLMRKLLLQRKIGVGDNYSECMVPLHQVKSLRQRLLQLRFVQPDLKVVPIPMMQEQIRQNTKLIQFIQKEDVQKNYELEFNRQQKEGGPQILEDFITENATRKRLLIIKGILNQRQIETRLKKTPYSGGLLNLDNVVSEFHFEAAASLLAGCVKQAFTKRRRLGPKKKSISEKKNVHQISEIQISIHVVQGNNVPIRSEQRSDLQEIKKNLQQLTPVKDVINKLYQMKKVTPSIQIQLDLDSKNVFVIKYKEQYKRVHLNQDQKSLLSKTNLQSQGQGLGLGQGLGYGQGQGQSLGYGQGQGFTGNNQGYGGQDQQYDQQVNTENDEYTIEQLRIATDKQQIETTSEVEGVNPEWNELIDFRIGRERETMLLEPVDVINSRNKLVFTLYDQIGSVRQEPGNVDRYKLIVKRHYLGQVTIPLLQLFQQEKISGTFRLNRPIMMLNYETLKIDQFLNDKQNKESEANQLHNKYHIIDPHIPTTLEISLTLDPTIITNQEFATCDYFPGAELTNFFLYGIRHLENLAKNAKLKGRNIRFWAENLRGESVFLPRFLTPLQPPQMDQSNAIEKAARFVSLIPFKNDTEHFQDLPDIYCDCQEFIDLRAGDFEEHAILLCCFFMHIDQKINKRDDIKSYVVMGKGLPEGKTQYVMRRLIGSNFVEIWNPQTGEPFVFQNEEYLTKFLYMFTVSQGFKNLNDIEDQACPLTSIGCVFDDKNVYVNIQASDNPGEISYDIDDPKKWEPFLHQDQYKSFFPKGLETVQRQLFYDAINPERAYTVQNNLEAFLEKQIEDFRKNSQSQNKSSFTTKFVNHRYAEFTTHIRETLLVKLESFKFRIRTTGLAKAAGEVPQEKKEEGVNLGSFNQGDQSKNQWDYSKSLDYLFKEQTELIRQKDKYIKGGKDIYGFPLNFSYIDNMKAWDEVKATGIQAILSDDIEYLCIVKCFPYPHYILSTWVFIAVLYDHNSLQ